MKPYSGDLRERVVGAVERGTKRSEVVATCRVSLPTIKRWLKRWRETRSLSMTPVPGRPAVKTRGLAAALPTRLATHADATLEEHRSWWEETAGHGVSPSTMSRAITALAWTRKKRP